jgi:hypothetical protein
MVTMKEMVELTPDFHPHDPNQNSSNIISRKSNLVNFSCRYEK